MNSAGSWRLLNDLPQDAVDLLALRPVLDAEESRRAAEGRDSAAPET